MRRVCALPSKPPMSAAHALRAFSPLWPNGGWPRSCASTGGVDHVGIEAEAAGELAPDLRDLERVREPVAREVEA